MDWYEDDEMMRQWEEVSKEEEHIMKEKRKDIVCMWRVCKEFQSLWFLTI